MKLTNLPRNIIKVSKYMYRDSHTGERIHISKLASKCPIKPVNTQLKEEIIQSKRWDLNY